MTTKQRDIIAEQHAVLKLSEIDIGTVACRLERQMADLKRAASCEMQAISARAHNRVRELGLEFKLLGEEETADA